MLEKIDLLPNDSLLRRVQFLDPLFIKEDGTPASSSFTLKKLKDGRFEDGLSVEVERLTTFQTAIQDVNRFRLFALTVAYVQSLELACEHDPLPDNFAHALIKGNISRSVARKLAQGTVRIPFPEEG